MLLQPPGDLRWVVAGVSSVTPGAGSAQESYTAISAHVKKITTSNYHHLPFGELLPICRKYAHSGGPETGEFHGGNGARFPLRGRSGFSRYRSGFGGNYHGG